MPLKNTENHVLSLGADSGQQRGQEQLPPDERAMEFKSGIEAIWQELRSATKINGALVHANAAKSMQDLGAEFSLQEVFDSL
ncbi:hypothetical protein ABTE19_20690, partial [Acinetobacter baumannii]